MSTLRAASLITTLLLGSTLLASGLALAWTPGNQCRSSLCYAVYDDPSGCAVNLGTCPQGHCTVNLGMCSQGHCAVNTGTCDKGRCTVNTNTCYGACAINTGYCGSNARCTVNTGFCTLPVAEETGHPAPLSPATVVEGGGEVWHNLLS